MSSFHTRHREPSSQILHFITKGVRRRFLGKVEGRWAICFGDERILRIVALIIAAQTTGKSYSSLYSLQEASLQSLEAAGGKVWPCTHDMCAFGQSSLGRLSWNTKPRERAIPPLQPTQGPQATYMGYHELSGETNSCGHTCPLPHRLEKCLQISRDFWGEPTRRHFSSVTCI